MATRLEVKRVEDIIVRQQGTMSQEVHDTAREIVEEVRNRGEAAILRYRERFENVPSTDPLYISQNDLHAALDALNIEDRERLIRITDRITAFATSQREALKDLRVSTPSGEAGHTVSPLDTAGCYAPGGRYPLPSSVLMTCGTAKAAGVSQVWVSSPTPNALTLAAAAVAGADGVIATGGAHAIAAMAFGSGPMPAAQIVVGPGNVYVTAAKQYIAGEVSIDMLAGPSELVVVADATADSSLVTADLLAQAEHDVHAFPILVTTDASIIERVNHELENQLKDLPTAKVAEAALENGGAILCADFDEVVKTCDTLAPEHLQLSIAEPESVWERFANYGAIFLGEPSAEVLGDYGFGPNHALPTGGQSKKRGGLSVFDFLRVRTWMKVESLSDDPTLADDVSWMAKQEGLVGHERAIQLRRTRP